MTKRVGGQALFHGVMMRCGNKIAVATRQKDGSLNVTCKETRSNHKRLLKIPMIRGLAALWDSLRSSIRSVTFRKGGVIKAILAWLLYFAVAFGIIFGLDRLLADVFFSSYLLENLFWCGVLFGEILLFGFFLRLLPPVRRLFGYHAAEHMCINCYEQGKEMTIENVRTCSRIHLRCGSNLAANSIIGVILFEIFLPPFESILLYYALDTLGVLLIFALAYEAMRYAEKHTNRRARAIGFFGGLLQKYITTAPPTDDMIECGIAALLKGIE